MKFYESIFARSMRVLHESRSKPMTGRLRDAFRSIISPAYKQPSKHGHPSPLSNHIPAFVANLLTQLGVPMPRPKKGKMPIFGAGDVDETTLIDAPRAGGIFLTSSYTCSAGTRAYKLYIPRCYDGRPLPLLVMLHGCTQTPDDFAAGTRANQFAEEHEYFVCYPAQSSNDNISGCWNWFQPDDQTAVGGEPAIIAGMTRQIVEDYQIDTRRIYVAGLSAGGAMAAILGLGYPHLYAAVGVHSGLPVGAAVDISSAMALMKDGGKRSRILTKRRYTTIDLLPPMIVFHGDADKTVHPLNADAVAAQFLGAQERRSPLQTIVQAGRVAEGRAYTRSSNLDASGKTIVDQWIIHGTAHAWSGGSSDGSYTDPKGPDAMREMMAFFENHSLPSDRVGLSNTALQAA